MKVAEGSATATATRTGDSSGSSVASKHGGIVSWTLVVGALVVALLGAAAIL